MVAVEVEVVRRGVSKDKKAGRMKLPVLHCLHYLITLRISLMRPPVIIVQ